jgi:hypothetical protein
VSEAQGKYVGEAPDGIPWAFDVAELTTFAPSNYVEAINSAAIAGYTVLVIDSLSHAWEGKGGALEMKDLAAEKAKNNTYVAWRTVSPEHNRLIDAILQSPMHVITTMRSRMDYVQETSEETGKIVGVRRVGMSPIQRPGMEYEFDVVADMDYEHTIMISKSRCSAISDARANKPGPAFLAPLVAWLESGSAEALRVMDERRALIQRAKELRADGKPPAMVANELGNGITLADVIAWTA